MRSGFGSSSSSSSSSSAESRVKVPASAGDMLEFTPIASQQTRLRGWSAELEDMKNKRRIEALNRLILKDDLLHKISSRRDCSSKNACVGPRTAKCKQGGQERPGRTAENENMVDKERRNLEEEAYLQAEQSRFDGEVRRCGQAAASMAADIENAHNPIHVIGWKLLLQRAPFSTDLEAVRERVHRARSCNMLLGFLERICCEYERQDQHQPSHDESEDRCCQAEAADAQEKTLADDLETFSQEESCAAALSSLRKVLVDPVNCELVRTLSARLGFGANTRNRPIKRPATGSFSAVFSQASRVNAASIRQREAMLNHVILLTGHIRAENESRKALILFKRDRRQRQIRFVEERNRALVAQSKAFWQKNVADPVLERNAERERQAMQQPAWAIERLKAQRESTLEKAKLEHQSLVVQPLEQFNASVGPLMARAKAARRELKLLKRFSELLFSDKKRSKARSRSRDESSADRGDSSSNDSGNEKKKSRQVVPMHVLRHCLQEAFQSRPAGSASNVANAKRATKDAVGRLRSSPKRHAWSL